MRAGVEFPSQDLIPPRGADAPCPTYPVAYCHWLGNFCMSCYLVVIAALLGVLWCPTVVPSMTSSPRRHVQLSWYSSHHRYCCRFVTVKIIMRAPLLQL